MPAARLQGLSKGGAGWMHKGEDAVCIKECQQNGWNFHTAVCRQGQLLTQ
jgi:hypothetical protein